MSSSSASSLTASFNGSLIPCPTTTETSEAQLATAKANHPKLTNLARHRAALVQGKPIREGEPVPADESDAAFALRQADTKRGETDSQWVARLRLHLQGTNVKVVSYPITTLYCLTWSLATYSLTWVKEHAGSEEPVPIYTVSGDRFARPTKLFDLVPGAATEFHNNLIAVAARYQESTTTPDEKKQNAATLTLSKAQALSVSRIIDGQAVRERGQVVAAHFAQAPIPNGGYRIDGEPGNLAELIKASKEAAKQYQATFSARPHVEAFLRATLAANRAALDTAEAALKLARATEASQESLLDTTEEIRHVCVKAHRQLLFALSSIHIIMSQLENPQHVAGWQAPKPYECVKSIFLMPELLCCTNDIAKAATARLRQQLAKEILFDHRALPRTPHAALAEACKRLKSYYEHVYPRPPQSRKRKAYDASGSSSSSYNSSSSSSGRYRPREDRSRDDSNSESRDKGKRARFQE